MWINKCTKLVCTILNKENCVVHIRALKQALNHGLKLTKVHRVIQFDQEAWLNPILIWILAKGKIQKTVLIKISSN